MKRALVRRSSRREMLGLLGLREGPAAATELKEAFRKKALEVHPDVSLRAELSKDEATRRFQEVENAYRELLREAQAQHFQRQGRQGQQPSHAGAAAPREGDFNMEWLERQRQAASARNRGAYVDNLEDFLEQLQDARMAMRLRRAAAAQVSALIELIRQVTGARAVQLTSRRAAEIDLVALRRLFVLLRTQYLGADADDDAAGVVDLNLGAEPGVEPGMEGEGGGRENYASLDGITLVLAGSAQDMGYAKADSGDIRGAFDEHAATLTLELSDVTIRWRDTLAAFHPAHAAAAARARAARHRASERLRRVPALAGVVQFVPGHSCDHRAFDAFLERLYAESREAAAAETAEETDRPANTVTVVVEDLRRHKPEVTLEGRLQLDAGMAFGRVVSAVGRLNGDVATQRATHRARQASIRALTRQLREDTANIDGLWGSGLHLTDVKKGPGVTWKQVEVCLGRLVTAASRRGQRQREQREQGDAGGSAGGSDSDSVSLVIGRMYGNSNIGEPIIPWDWRAS